MSNSSVSNKADFLSLIQSLLSESSKDWENQMANDFIEALGAWLNDAEGYYKNFNLEVDANKPSWQLFADAVQAARYYE